MKILVVSNNYPSNKRPSKGVFVYKLVQKFVELGHEVTVVSPQKTWDICLKTTSYGLDKARVIRPWTISFSAKNIFGFNTYKLTHWLETFAVRRIINKQNIDFDLVYCHFLRSAFLGTKALKEHQKPIVAAVGEYAGLDITVKWFGEKRFLSHLSKINGFIAVSEQIKDKLESIGTCGSKIIVEPNAVDLKVFQKADKKITREKFGIPADKFILAFTGNFNTNKGPNRVLQAVEDMEKVGVILIGGGAINLKSKQIVFKKRVPAGMVPEILNCADAFILPTLKEGSNNSIIEAMACGLPIISSDIPEIRSQCDPSFSILVNPLNVQAIRDAIIKIKNQPKLREQMSENAMIWSRKFDLDSRARRILDFLKRFVL